jgi:hypothetical protein
VARRPRDLDDIDSIFAAEAASGEKLDWDFVDSWAEEWGIDEEPGDYRTRYGPGR